MDLHLYSDLTHWELTAPWDPSCIRQSPLITVCTGFSMIKTHFWKLEEKVWIFSKVIEKGSFRSPFTQEIRVETEKPGTMMDTQTFIRNDYLGIHIQYMSVFFCNLIKLNLDVSCGDQFWIESADIFFDVVFCPLHGTLGFITIYQSINADFFALPQCFTFRIILNAILRVFALCSHHGGSSLSKKDLMDTRLLKLWASC